MKMLYTLDEAREIIYEEQKRERRYYIKQKIMGLLFVAISIIYFIVDRDITLLFFFLPAGVAIFITKKKVFVFK